MAERKRISGLGRGLSALLDESAAAAASGERAIAEQVLPLASIVANPRQPRRNFDNTALAELTESVKARGVLQPILVRKLPDGRHEIVAGERRWRAAQAAQLHEIPVVIRELDDAAAFEVALVENVQRADLNPIEEAEGFARLTADFGHSQLELGRLVGKSRSHVANLLRLLELPDEVRAMVRDGDLAMGHARALIGVPDAIEIAARAVAQGLSVRQVEALARGPAPARVRQRAVSSGSRDPDTEALEATLAEALGLPVRIGDGSVAIAYTTLGQLDMICARLGGEPPRPRGIPRVRIL